MTGQPETGHEAPAPAAGAILQQDVVGEADAVPRQASLILARLVRSGLFLPSLALFSVAIELIKVGARDAAALVGNFVDTTSVPNALGFGWFSIYRVLSGSPVAAVSVAFLAAGGISQLASYAMIVGSRLGASLIVLFISFVYVPRGHERRTGLTMGLLSLIVTGSV